MARDRSGNETVAVPLAILDDLALANPRFIKCDVEGHELSVFTGARRLIERCRPVVQFESVSADAGQLFAFFEELGYLGTMFLGNDYRPYTMGWQVPHPKFGLGGHRDFLFFPESAIGSTIPLPLYERIRTSAAASAVAGCPASSMPRARPAG